MFIVLDGMDAAGKSTQVEMLREHYQALGRTVTVVHHPAHTGLGRNILRQHVQRDGNRYTPEAEGYLYAADMVEVLQREIAPALAAGHVVLAHRWWPSSYVYQCTVDNGDAAHIMDATFRAVAGITPTAIIILFADPAVLRERLAARTAIDGPYERDELLNQAASGFIAVVDKYQEQQPLWLVDVTNLSKEQTFQEIQNIIQHTSESVYDTEPTLKRSCGGGGSCSRCECQ